MSYINQIISDIEKITPFIEIECCLNPKTKDVSIKVWNKKDHSYTDGIVKHDDYKKLPEKDLACYFKKSIDAIVLGNKEFLDGCLAVANKATLGIED
jgi:hypothetical protein